MRRLLAILGLLLVASIATGQAIDGRGPVDTGRRQAWLARDLVGTTAWYRSDLGVSTTVAVATWSNGLLLGTGKDFTQATSGVRFIYNATDAAYGNRPTLGTVGTTEWMATGTWGTALTQPFLIWIVGETWNNKTDARVILDGIGASNRAEIYGDVTTGFLKIGAGATLATSTDIGGTPHIIGALFNGSSSAIYLDSPTATVTGNAGTQSALGLTVGTYYGATSAFGRGKVAEIEIQTGTPGYSDRFKYVANAGRRFGITITP